MIYVLLFLYTFSCLIVSYRLMKKRVQCGLITEKYDINVLFFLISFALGCSLVMGLRSVYVGVDTAAYYRHFEYIKETSLIRLLRAYNPQFSLDLGYACLMKLSSFFSNSYFFFQYIISLAYCLGMVKFIYHGKNDPLTASLIFLGIGLFFQPFNITRQYFAAMLLINSWLYFKDNHFCKSVPLFLLAVACHGSSVIFSVVYVLHFFRNSKILYYIVPAFICLTIANYDFIMSFFVDFFPKYQKYYSNMQTGKAGFIVVVWLVVAALSFYVMYMKDKFDNGKKLEALLCLIYVACCFVGLKFMYFERLGVFFMPFVIPVICNVIDSVREPNAQFVFKLICLFGFCGLFFLTGLGTEQYQYSFFWD